MLQCKSTPFREMLFSTGLGRFLGVDTDYFAEGGVYLQASTRNPGVNDLSNSYIVPKLIWK